MDFHQVDHFVFQKMAATRLPSVTAALVKDGELLWSTAHGFRDLERAIPATPATIYGIGSVTKSFTALAILQLAEQGKLGLDDPVEDHLAFPVQPFGEQVRIKHFLSHTSGIPALAMSESISRSRTGTGDHWLPVATYDDLLTFLQEAQDWVFCRPGERWFYLNEGYVLLGKIIEQCSGMSYYDYLRQYILAPLGMDRTVYLPEEVEADPDAAVPYVVANDGSRIPSSYPYSAFNSKGGIISSVLDLAKYLGMYLNGGTAPGSRLLSKHSLDEMMQPRIPTAVKDSPFGPVQYAYGLGIFSNFLGRRLVGHGGSVRVSTAYLGFLPEDGLGVAVLANGAGYSPTFIGQYALAAALGEDPDALPFVQQETLLKSLSGHYLTYQGTMKAVVRKAGDLLMLTLEDRLNPVTLPLYPQETGQSPYVFYTHSGGARIDVEFHRQGGGISMLYERYAFRKTGS
jgi:CubicO group peptidase (beta-lactamase class C family)